MFRLQHHRMCPDGARSFSGGECSPDESGERADGETLLSVTDSDSDLDVWDSNMKWTSGPETVRRGLPERGGCIQGKRLVRFWVAINYQAIKEILNVIPAHGTADVTGHIKINFFPDKIFFFKVDGCFFLNTRPTFFFKLHLDGASAHLLAQLTPSTWLKRTSSRGPLLDLNTETPTLGGPFTDWNLPVSKTLLFSLIMCHCYFVKLSRWKTPGCLLLDNQYALKPAAVHMFMNFFVYLPLLLLYFKFTSFTDVQSACDPCCTLWSIWCYE